MEMQMSGKTKNSLSVSVSVFLLLLLLLLSPRQAAAIIYGDDDRVDYYQLTNLSTINAADSIVALFDSSDITCDDDNCYLLNLQSLAEWYLATDPIGSGNPLCSDQRYLDEPSPAFCSGFMVARDVIVTAGHCIDDSSCPNTVFVFNYHMTDINTPVTTFDIDDVYHCSEIIARDSSGTNDWAIVEVDRPIVGHEALPIRTEGIVEDGAPLVVIGHPVGLPMKIDPNAEVRDNNDLPYFQVDADAYGGNSGSAVFGADADGNVTQVEGILVRGYDDWDFVADGNGLCDRLSECPDEGCPGWEEVTRATNVVDFIPEDYIVVFTDQNAKDNAAGSATYPINHNYSIIPGFAASLDAQQKALLLTDPNITYVEPDLPLDISQNSAASTPYVPNPGQTIPYGVDKIQAPDIWPTTRGSGVAIAVLDTGIDVNHPDRGTIIASESFVPGQSVDDGSSGHGTHVSGTVAAADDGDGVVGVAPEAGLLIGRVLSDQGSGYVSDEIAGIEYAADQGARVINMSFGTYYYSQSEYEALQNANTAGILLAAAAGDSNTNQPYYPADYNCVISVTAVDINNIKADFSNYSSTADHVAAPGVEILSTALGGYEIRSSTDMACAHVSGLAALLFAAGGPATTPDQVQKAIQQTTLDLGAPGPDSIYGRGLVNAPRALAYLLADGIPANCTEAHDFGYGLLPDLDDDCYVSFKDLKIFAAQWLNDDCSDANQWCNGTNFDGSGTVAFPSFADFAQSWLNCNDPEEINCSPCTPNWP
jgi:subtilisin family serine protease